MCASLKLPNNITLVRYPADFGTSGVNLFIGTPCTAKLSIFTHLVFNQRHAFSRGGGRRRSFHGPFPLRLEPSTFHWLQLHHGERWFVWAALEVRIRRGLTDVITITIINTVITITITITTVVTI